MVKKRREKPKKEVPILWLWEFSKKVVSTAFLLYILAVVYALFMANKAIMLTMDTTALSTFITEMNETFRVVVGGYMLKAAGENVVKIATTYLKGKNKKAKETQSGQDEEEQETEIGLG
ncbi:MAG: hypothetical protein U0L36_01160 [Acutalibacteraceae bacterium]|nr:hypothetical protein [Acutalibacteraceae bacterium]